MERHQRNPYIFGSPIYQDQQFFNRIELLRELTIPDSRAYYLKGNRRVGKTSLLRRIERELLATLDCFPVYLDISIGESLADFARIFQRAVKEGIQKLGLPPIIFEDRENVFKAISVWIEYSKLHGRANCFILLDESERFLKLSAPELKKLHRAVLNRDPNLTLVITATSKLQELYEKEVDGDYFLNSFITKYIGCLSLEDIEPLVRQNHHLNNAEKVSADEKIIADIIRYSGLHPYLVQRLSYNLFESENVSLRPLNHRDLVLDESLRHIIKMDFDHLDTEHQQILVQFSWEQSISPDYFKGIPEPKVNSILVELEQLGFLRSDGQQYYLGNYFLAQWLEEQQPPVPLIKNGLHEAHDGETGYNIDIQTTKETITYTMQKLNVFISYSHKDEPFKEALDAHLTILRRSDKINTWNDRAILAGTEWDDEIKQQLEDAHIILLLISVNFLASDYIWKEELARAMERHDRGEAKVIPIFIKPCEWKGASFGKVQGLPKDAKPVGNADNDEAWTGVAAGIRTLVDKLLEKGLGATSSPNSISVIKPDEHRKLPPPVNIAAIEKAINGAEYATAIELLDEYFGDEPTSQYSTLRQTIEHYLSQALIPPPATLQGLRMLINKLKK